MITLKNTTDKKYFAIADSYKGKVYLYVLIGGSITVCKGIENLKVGDAYYGRIEFRHGNKIMFDYEKLEHVSIRHNRVINKGSDSQSQFKPIDDFLVKVKRQMVINGIEPGSKEWDQGKSDAADLFCAVHDVVKHISKDTKVWRELYAELNA